MDQWIEAENDFLIYVILRARPPANPKALAKASRYFRCAHTLFCVPPPVILGAGSLVSSLKIKPLAETPVIPVVRPVERYQ